MSHNTNHLEKTSKKCKKFHTFLHFVRKKIISLQEINKSSVLLYSWILKRKKFQKIFSRISVMFAVMRASYSKRKVILTTSGVDSMSSLFMNKVKKNR